MRVEWDDTAALTSHGQMPFFIEYLKVAGLFDGLVADCPLTYRSPNAPMKRDVLGTTMFSILRAGHKRYAHSTTLRCDGVLPELLNMTKIVSEDAVAGPSSPSAKMRAHSGCSAISIIARCRYYRSHGSSTWTQRSSHFTAIRMERPKAVIRRSQAGPAMSITLVCWPVCGWFSM